jgi:uncharacterized protein involved in exopolysaccharide biosynthesis
LASDNDDEDEGGGGGAFQPEVIKSYLAFAGTAIRRRWWLSIAVFVGGLGLTFLAMLYLPRKFTCTTVLMGQGSQVLEGNDRANPFAAAAQLVLSHENLERLVHQTDLIRKFEQRRPPLLALKDRMIARIVGEMDREVKLAVQVGTLESALYVADEGGTLSVSATWTDGVTAKELAEAARDSYIKARHDSEMAAFKEKMAILTGHSKRTREEVDALAAQTETLQKQNREKAEAEGKSAAKSAVRAAPRSSTFGLPAEIPAGASLEDLKKKLDEKKKKLDELEGDRERKIREERAKVAELKLRLTPSHPEVVMAEQRVSLLAQPSSEVLLLRSEVASLENDIAQRSNLPTRPRSGGGGAAGELLPQSVVGLLQQDDAVDPAMTAQLQGAVGRYGSLQDELRSARIQLDTAQAAFNQRYRVMIPAVAPTSPKSPKMRMILLAGVAISLLLSLILPILLELRTGIMVERWQVHMVQLPVLAELRLPPRSND